MEAINPSQCTILRNSVNPLSEGDKVCLCELYEPGVNGNPSLRKLFNNNIFHR